MSVTRFVCEQLESRRLLSLTVFNLPHDEFATGLTAGPHNSLWTSDANSGHIVRIDASGHVRQFNLGPDARPTNLIMGAGGNIWFIDNGQNNVTSKIGFLTPAGVAHEFTVPDQLEAGAIVAGPDGNVWFLANSPYEAWTYYYYTSPTIGSVSRTGQFQDYSLAPSLGDVTIGGLSVGPDRTLDFTASSEFAGPAPQLVKVNTSGQIVSTADAPIYTPLLAADGNTYEAIAGGIAKLNSDSTSIIVASTSLSIGGLFNGPNGRIWFQDNSGDIGYMNADGTLVIGDPPNGVAVNELLPIDNGNVLWLRTESGNQIERFDLRSGILSPTAAVDVAAGPNPNLTLATFGDLAPKAKASDLSARIHWSDGGTTSGRITRNASGCFTLSASHLIKQLDTGIPTFANFTIVDRATGESAKGQLTLKTVYPAPTDEALLTNAVAGIPFAGNILKLSGVDLYARTKYSVIVGWGNQSDSTSSLSLGSDGNVYVAGSLTFASPGTYWVEVDIRGPGDPASDATPFWPFEFPVTVTGA